MRCEGEGGCEVKGQWGGGGGGSFVSTYKRAGRDGMTIHKLPNSYQKRDFNLLCFESRGKQKPEDVALLQSDRK